MGELARPGGLILVSGLCGDGLDIRTLGALNAVSPPHHPTFLSQQGARALVDRAGLDCVSFETPGQLDVDILRSALLNDDDVVEDPELRGLRRMKTMRRVTRSRNDWSPSGVRRACGCWRAGPWETTAEMTVCCAAPRSSVSGELRHLGPLARRWRCLRKGGSTRRHA